MIIETTPFGGLSQGLYQSVTENLSSAMIKALQLQLQFAINFESTIQKDWYEKIFSRNAERNVRASAYTVEISGLAQWTVAYRYKWQERHIFYFAYP